MNFFIRVILLAYFVIGTQSSLAQSSIIDVVTHSDIVTDSDNIVGNGDVVVFTTKVTNISNITISSLTISNSLVGIDGSVLSLSSPITFVNNSGSSSEGDLIAGEVSTYVSTYTFDSSGVTAGGISLTVSGTASTPGNTNNVIDVSDDGDNSDGNIINDPTQVVINTIITLVEGTKVENYIDNDSNGSIGLGDQLEYIITVYNNGEEDLENIELFDILKDLNDNTLALVAPFTPPGPIFVSSDQGSINSNILVGETVTYKAVYLVQQGAVDSGGLNNCLDVQVDGVNSGRRFTDTADNGNDSDGNLINDCTASTITATPSIEVTKSAIVQDVNGNSQNDPNDIINYTIRIENDGDLTLTGLVIADTFVDGNSNSISLNSAPAFSTSSLGSSEGTLQVGEVAIYTAAYTISLISANSGSVSNSLLVTASSPGQSNNVSDTSDDGIQDDGNIIDDPTITSLSINKKIEATKTFSIADNGNGQNGQGDVVTYTITIENTGQINVSGITLVDQLTNCDGSSILTLSSGPTWNSNSGSSAQGSLDPGEIASYTATYTIGSVEIDSGCILNTVTATASSPGFTNDITDVSDDGNDADGNLVNDPTRIDFSVNPVIEVTKTGLLIDNGDDLPGVSDTAVFTITIVNTGNTALSTITLSDTFTRLDGTALTLDSGPSFNSSSGGSAQGTLQSGESATYTASYTVDAADVASNAVVNQVTVSAEAFNGTVITDVSDNGNDLDGNTENDITEIRLDYAPLLEVTKTVSVSANPVLGDVAVYSINIENKGNVNLNTLSIVDTFVGLAGASISLDAGPTFTSASLGSSEGNIVKGEIATYTATYTISQGAIDSGGFRNTAVVSARNPGSSSTDVSDASDDGDDTDGNINNDPTDVVISEDAFLEAVKTSTYTDSDSDSQLSFGDTVNYSITVQNKSNVTLDNLQLTDDLQNISLTSSMTLDTGPSFVSSNLGSSFGSLKPNEIASFIGTYLIRQADVDAGGISNQVSATAQTPANTVLYDLSDDNDDFDENTENDRTESPITRTPLIEVTKTSTITDQGDGQVGLGDTITYSISVFNAGNQNLSSVTLDDYFTTMNGNALTLSSSITFVSASLGSNEGSLLVSETAEYTSTFIINQTSIDDGGTSNIVTVTAASSNATVTDISDDGDDADGNLVNDPTQNIFSGSLELEATKTYTITDSNSDGITGIGDIINYSIVVENKGTESLTNFSITDTLTDANGNSLSLNASPTSSDGSIIAPLSTKTYLASYTISQSALDNGGLKNTALVQASNIAGTIYVTDISDDGDDSDSNTATDTTDVIIAANSSLNLTKTYVNIDNDSDGVISSGDKLVYTFSVINDGNITQNYIFITDAISDFDGNTLALDSYASPNRLAFNSNSNGSTPGTLISGEVGTYTATYTVQSANIASGGISNTATASSFVYIDGNPVIKAFDKSDDGDDTDGNTIDDPTLSYFGGMPIIEVTKTATYTGSADGADVGDIAVFTITVENKSTQDVIQNLTFVDTLTDTYLSGNTMSSTVTFNSASAGSSQGTLTIGETATYTSSYTITQSDIDAGGLRNSITFEGTSARNPVQSEKDVSDVSDNGNDLDGNLIDDPVILILGTDSDGDGTPDSTDIDDDGDGILDRDEQCLTFLLDGNSFESYTGAFPPQSPGNRNSPYPNISTAPPFTSVNGDGEVWSSSQGPQGTSFSPQQGFYFIELLTNASSANDGSYWNETSLGSNGNYDRIMVIENVYPNRTYNINYYQQEGGRFVATHAGGGASLVQVQSMQTNYAVSFISTSTSSWVSNTVSFTTDSQTTRVAVLFSAYSPGINSSVQLDAISMTASDSCNNDIDGDGVPNGLDLDSDNDGIYDVIESGNEALDTNNDGIISGLDTGYLDSDLNGASDVTESNVLKDSDADGIIDVFELDSDNDGCNDVQEAGYTDGNSDGILGGSPVTQDSNGKVTSGSDGYTQPQDLNIDLLFDYRDAAYDVGCYNPALDVVKTYTVSDTNGNGINDVGDVINYTVVATNTGGLDLLFTNTNDILAYGSNQNTLTLNWSSTSTSVLVTPTHNLFKYSNYIEDYSTYWLENNNGQATPQSEYGYVPNIPYYFNTNSGSSYSEVDHVFTTEGFGVTRSPYTYAGTDARVHKYSRVSNQNNVTYYHYQNVSLEANTTYTVSLYAAAPNNTYYNTVQNYEKLRFVSRPPSGTDTYSDYNRVTGPVTSNNSNSDSGWSRYSHTFTTGAAGTYRVGFSAPYFSNSWTRVWGVQLEVGSSAGRYSYTFSSTQQNAAESIFVDPSESALPAGESATFTSSQIITQEIFDLAPEISNSVTFTASYTSPGGISGTVQGVSDDGDDSDGNTENDPTVTSFSRTQGVEVTKTFTLTDVNSNTKTDVGDQVNYRITISNTGNTSLKSFTVTDTLSRSNGQTVATLGTASLTTVTRKNFFNYSYTIDDSGSGWSEYQGISGASNQNIEPPNSVPYYFNTNSGAAYSTVDSWFPNQGNGTTPASSSGSLNYSDSGIRPGRIYTSGTEEQGYHNGYWAYKIASLEEGQTYTFSVYVKGTNGSQLDDSFRFIIDNDSNAQDATVVSTDQFMTTSWVRKSYTFTASFSGNHYVGIHPTKYSTNYYWGLQLEKGNLPTRFFYTSNLTPEVALSLPLNVPLSTYIEWGTGQPDYNSSTYAAAFMNGTSAHDQQFNSGLTSIIEVEPENFTNFDNRPTSGHFDNGGPYEHNGHRYYRETTTWDFATHKSHATAASGYLAVPNTKAEWDFLKNMISTNFSGGNHYIGVYQDNTSSDFTSDNIKGGWTVTDGSGSTVLLPGDITSLAPNSVSILEYTHTITQADVNSGGLSNSVIASANGFSTVSDTSDDGDDTDGNLVDDPTVTELSKTSSLTVVKTAVVSDVNSDSLNGVGDIITYTITVSNTGNTNLNTPTLLDQLTDGLGNVLSLNSTPTYVSSYGPQTASATLQNIFKYSNRIDDTDYDWNEQGSNEGSVSSEWGYPPNIPYYFSTNSGQAYSGVDYVFTTEGLGNTRSPYLYGGTDNIVHKYSRLRNNNNVNNYVFQDVSLEANTAYTVSVYAAAHSSSYVNSSNNVDKLRFVYRPWGGSDSWSEYKPLTGWVQSNNVNQNNNGWARYSYTFTTGAAGNYRVGFSPPYNGGNYSRFWGAQLEKGSSPTRLIYTYSALDSYIGSTTVNTNTFVDSGKLEIQSINTYTASYTITQSDVDSGFVSNIATITSIDPDGSTVVSATIDDPTIVSLATTSTLEVIKTSTISDVNANGLNDIGDIITYSIVVSNTGYVTLSSITPLDTPTDYSGASLSLNAPLSTVTSTSGSTSSTILPNGSTTFTASLTVNQQALNSGGVTNTILITASSPGQTDNVTSTHQVYTQLTTVSPVIEITKTATITDNGDGVNGVADIITYSITIENKGNVNLQSLDIDDIFTDGNGNSVSLALSPTYQSTTISGTTSANDDGILGINHIDNYTANYVVKQADVDSGNLSNVVSVTASSPGFTDDASDVSDDGDDSDGNTVNDPTVTTFTPSASIEITKTATITDVNGNSENDLNDIISYTLEVKNTGNVNLSTPTLSDYLSDGVGLDLSSELNGPTYQSQTLSPSIVEYTVTIASVSGQNKFFIDGIQQKNIIFQKGYTYRFIQSDASNNSHPINFSTISDGTHNSGTSYTTSITSSGSPGSGNAYTQIYISDSTPALFYYCTNHTGMGGNTSSIGSVSGVQNILRPNEIVTYTASYTISGSSANTAFISNVASVTASSPGNSNDVSDLSDDGDNSDGNTTNDPTIVELVPDPKMEITKTVTQTADNGDGLLGTGDTITYTIVVENTGNLLLSGLSLSDTMADGNGNSLSLDSGLTFVSASLGSSSGTLQLTEVATFTGTHILTRPTVNSGLVSNSIYGLASAGDLSNNVSDTSDNGDDSDGNLIDDSTVFNIPQVLDLNVTKTQAHLDLDGLGTINLGDKIIYTIEVNNLSNVELTSVSLVDTFTDLLSNTLTLDSGPTFISASLSSPSGTIKSNEVATYTATFTINQAAIDGAGLSNSVLVSSSSPGLSNNVTDTSDDGDDSDGNTDNDTTVTEINLISSLDVTKTATVNDTNSNSRTDINDIITYTITVLNNGETTLTGISFNDVITTSLGAQLSLTANPARISTSDGSPVGTLKVSETALYTAQFIINQTAYDAEFISNTVTVTANSIGLTGNVSDTSDDGDDSDGNTVDDPTVTIMTPNSEIEATKTYTVIDDGNGSIDVGDIIKFNITVENTGNAPLSGVSITDLLSDGNGTTIALSDGPYFTTASMGSTVGNLQIGETGNYVAYYTITQSAYDSSSISNIVSVTASSPYGTNDTTDLGDDGNDLDGNTVDDPTVVIITSAAAMNVVKIASVYDDGDGFTNFGDTINYTITVQNTGASALTTVTLTDTLTDNASNTLTLTNGPNFVSASQGSSQGNLNVGEIATYSASYLIEAAAANTGSIYNQVVAVASSPGELNDVTDTSDDNDDSDGNTTNDKTVVEMDFSPIIDITKTSSLIDNNSNSVTDLGDTIVYQISVRNSGNVSLSSLVVTDTLTDANLNPLTLSSGPNFVSSSLSSSEGSLLVGETATYSATFVIDQIALDSGGLLNSVYGLASSPGNSNNVSDTSDDGDDSDGNTVDDKTQTNIDQSIILEATKTATVTDNNSNGSTDLGDTIVYTITVENKGNVTLSSIGLTDTLLDGDGSALSLSSGPVFTSASASSAQGTLLVGETASYTASYTITQLALDTGSISNSVLVTGSSPGQSNNVTDTSDDGDDSDGNTEDDTTDITISNTPSLEVTKTAAITDNGDGAVGKGDVVQYTISVINNGNVTLSSLSVADVLSDLNSGTLSLSFGPSFSGSSQGSAQGTLKVGETASYIAYFIINQAAVDAGGLSNQASATASSPGNSNDVTDMSDDGDDSDGNTTDDPTVTTITTSSSLEVTKTAAVTDNGDGDTGASDVINYTITVENKGNVTLSGLTLVDTLTDGSGGSLTLTNGPSFSSTTLGSSPGTLKPNEVATYSGYYIISANAALTSSINNSVLATASSPGQSNNVTDTSDDGDDSDGNTTDDVTVVDISPNPGIEATKTAIVIDSNSNSANDQGDIIVYTITTENTGNVTLTGVNLTDTLTDNSGNALTLTSGPIFNSASASSSAGILIIGETATYTASYTIEADAAATGSIRNRVLVTSSSPGNTDDVIDISDNGDEQ